ncbi:MAG: Rieske (2Fe-2S) protein [Crocinitomicaceae bacterium]
MKTKWVRFAKDETELDKIFMGKSCVPLKVNATAVVLVKHQGEIYLVKNRCPHQGKPLDQASCEDGFIVCPWHQYAFDLKTGRGSGLYLENYPVEKREDGYYAAFEYFSWF